VPSYGRWLGRWDRRLENADALELMLHVSENLRLL